MELGGFWWLPFWQLIRLLLGAHVETDMAKFSWFHWAHLTISDFISWIISQDHGKALYTNDNKSLRRGEEKAKSQTPANAIIDHWQFDYGLDVQFRILIALFWATSFPLSSECRQWSIALFWVTLQSSQVSGVYLHLFLDFYSPIKVLNGSRYRSLFHWLNNCGNVW
jgi:hypothetical protein